MSPGSPASTGLDEGRTGDEAADPARVRLAGSGAALDGARQRVLGVRDGALRLKALLDRPLASYYLVLGCTLLLLGVGLMMVLSTSTAYDLYNGAPPYSMFEKQLLGALAGLVLMWLASKAPVRLFRAFAYPLLLATVLGLVLVLLFGREVEGAKRWLEVAGNEVQPSEFAKLALVLWGADLLARKEKLGQLTDWRHLLVPLLPGVAIVCMLVMLGNDLGTTFLLSVIFLCLLWVIGAPGQAAVRHDRAAGLRGPDACRRAPRRTTAHHRVPFVADIQQLPELLPADAGQRRARLGWLVRRRSWR